MLQGYVPTGRKKEDWKLYIKTKEQYDAAVASGIGWVLYENLPLSWDACLKELGEEKKDE